MLFPVSETTIFMYTCLLPKERISVLISSFGKQRPVTMWSGVNSIRTLLVELGLETMSQQPPNFVRGMGKRHHSVPISYSGWQRWHDTGLRTSPRTLILQMLQILQRPAGLPFLMDSRIRKNSGFV